MRLIPFLYCPKLQQSEQERVRMIKKMYLFKIEVNYDTKNWMYCSY